MPILEQLDGRAVMRVFAWIAFCALATAAVPV